IRTLHPYLLGQCTLNHLGLHSKSILGDKQIWVIEAYFNRVRYLNIVSQKRLTVLAETLSG
ncbi:MAG: hypothetical protein ACK521_10220, partial [bacterium]